LIRHLPNASWISIDEEMTGIMLPGNHNNNNDNNNNNSSGGSRPSSQQQQQHSSSSSSSFSKDEAPVQRYAKFKQIPERYSIIQLGICLFEERERSRTQRRVGRILTPPPPLPGAGPSAVDPATFIVVRGSDDDDDDDDDARAQGFLILALFVGLFFLWFGLVWLGLFVCIIFVWESV
jgi:hypothetical protein